ncbi:MAG: hypothetical protein SNJ64_05645 [Endomicrobiia bacterium]
MEFYLNQTFTQKFLLNEQVYKNFILCSNDNHPLHTNILFAREKGFEDIIMHGNILNVFLSYFIGECLPTKHLIINSQDIFYKNPIYLNEELVLEAVVSGIFESVRVVEFKYKFLKTDSKLAAKGSFQISLTS